MKDKKNLDRLFQERFKDFEEIPPEIAWKNIEAALSQKKKRRTIPLWYKLSGVAALFVFGFLGTRALLNHSKTEPTNPIVIEETTNPLTNKNRVVDSNDKNTPGQLNTSDEDLNKNNSVNEKPSFSTNKTFADENSNPEKPSQKEVQNNITSKKERTELVSNSSEKGENKSKQNKNNDFGLVNNSTKQKTKTNFETEAAIAGSNSQEANDKTNSEKNKSGITGENNIIKNDKQFVLEDFSSKASDKNKIDSAAVATLMATNEELNTLGELLKEKEKDQKPKVEPKENKWQITSNIAPVYLGSSSNGSPIDEQFANNSKDYQNTLSYGIGLNYDLNKRVTLRTGLNRVNFEYMTNGIEFFAGLEGRETAGLNSVNASNESVIIVQNISNDQTMNWKKYGSIEQRMDYFEIPLELSYKIINKKFSIDVIGGFSTLLLNDNGLMVVSDGLAIELEKANNLNPVHFSSNVGLGFRYRFLKSFQANFEPTFKYQFNTFSSNDGGFKPYFIGLYSGISYRF